ncbi:MAG: hypothetical protein F9K41_19185 [Sphingopyxis terrae]|nr:MAG: hypothetical protein F9K41_19185 [Sphingopyxis terrae]
MLNRIRRDNGASSVLLRARKTRVSPRRRGPITGRFEIAPAGDGPPPSRGNSILFRRRSYAASFLRLAFFRSCGSRIALRMRMFAGVTSTISSSSI